MNIADIVIDSAKNNTIIKTRHYLDQLELRRNDIVPNDDGVHDLLCNRNPVCISRGRTDDSFKLFYDIDAVYDLMIIISIKSSSPYLISLLAIHKQNAKRRPKSDE